MSDKKEVARYQSDFYMHPMGDYPGRHPSRFLEPRESFVLSKDYDAAIAREAALATQRNEAMDQAILLAENQRMRELLTKALPYIYAYLPIESRHVHDDIESFLAELS